jgi:glutamyl-Q tRNA(Asp) synthetase
LEDLAWLGLTWETPVWRQSRRMAAYSEALEALKAKGVLYRCFRTRKELLDDIGRAPHGLQAAEDGDGRSFAWGCPSPPPAGRWARPRP